MIKNTYERHQKRVITFSAKSYTNLADSTEPFGLEKNWERTIEIFGMKVASGFSMPLLNISAQISYPPSIQRFLFLR